MSEQNYPVVLSCVQIAVPDLEDGERAYTRLLGFEPVRRGPALQYPLRIGSVELVGNGSGISALRFLGSPGVGHADPMGVPVQFGEPKDRSHEFSAEGGIHAIDHVVVHSQDPERSRSYWGDQLGLRLALDRTFEARGLRILFFRSGGMTLEVVSPLGDATPPSPDRFYGITYRTRAIEAEAARLTLLGVDVGSVRPGFKPGTLVATVRSGTAGVPTLLLQDLSRDGEGSAAAN